MDLVVVALLTDPGVPQRFKAGRLIQGTCRDGDPVFSSGIPEHGGTAIAAEPSVDVGGLVRQRAEPFQTAVLDELQVVHCRKDVGGEMSVEISALGAVTAGDAREFAVYLVAYGAAEAPARMI